MTRSHLKTLSRCDLEDLVLQAHRLAFEVLVVAEAIRPAPGSQRECIPSLVGTAREIVAAVSGPVNVPGKAGK